MPVVILTVAHVRRNQYLALPSTNTQTVSPRIASIEEPDDLGDLRGHTRFCATLHPACGTVRIRRFYAHDKLEKFSLGQLRRSAKDAILDYLQTKRGYGDSLKVFLR